MKKLIIIIVVLLVLGAGFYLATHKSIVKQLLGQNIQTPPTNAMTTQSSGTQQTPHASGSSGRGRFGNMPQGSTPIFGQVTAITGNTITIQRQGRNGNGKTITVDLASSTQYTGGSHSSIQTGTRLGGYGTANSDGSINAQQITINPTVQGKRQQGQSANQ